MPQQSSIHIFEKSINISQKDITKELNISIATVRNWVKTGYLQQNDDGLITYKSYRDFKKNIIGHDKLTARANKLFCDAHNHDELYKIYHEKLQYQCADKLSDEYQTSLSYAYRNAQGIYYTPDHIIDKMFNAITGDVHDKVFCDPCCGGGNFLMGALRRGFQPKNMYGFDIDAIAVDIAKKRLQHANMTDANIQQGNFCDIAYDAMASNQILPYDVVLTNPPWGAKFDRNIKQQYTNQLNCAKTLDSSAIFLHYLMVLCQDNSAIGMLLPEAFFNIGNFQATRAMLRDYHISDMMDFDKAFKGLITKAKAIIIHKTPAKTNHKIYCHTPQRQYERAQSSFFNNPKQIFNFHITQEISDNITKIYQKPHITLKNNAKWALGIVTGNNKARLKDKPSKDYLPIYKGSDINADSLQTATNFIHHDLSQCQQVADLALYHADKKLAYRFISNRLVFYCDTKQNLFLNSANMLILHDNFPIAPEKIAWLMNTDMMNWLFQSLFDTHKILRGDIEELPIFHEFLMDNEKPNEKTLKKYLNL